MTSPISLSVSAFMCPGQNGRQTSTTGITRISRWIRSRTKRAKGLPAADDGTSAAEGPKGATPLCGCSGTHRRSPQRDEVQGKHAMRVAATDGRCTNPQYRSRSRSAFWRAETGVNR